MTATIIIPTINAQPDLLTACIAACESTMREGDELLVIEGGTFAENCNEGAKRAVTDHIVFLNDDTIPHLLWLDALTQPLSEYPKVAITGARLLYPDGRIQHTGIYFTTDDGVLTARNRTWDCPTGLVDAVTGAAMAFRTDTFNDLEGFDPGFRNGYEDVDLCLRAHDDGWDILYVAEATITHHESASGPARWAHVQHNVDRLQQLWTVKEA